MKIYIAGKITGFDGFKEKFKNVEKLLTDRGHICLNPTILPDGFEQHEYLKVCFSMIHVCDSIYMLDNWRESDGARAEHEYALMLGKTILYEEYEQ